MNRRYMMQEMYQQFLDEDDAWKKVAKDQVRKFAISCCNMRLYLQHQVQNLSSYTYEVLNHFKNGIIWVNFSFYIPFIFKCFA